VDNWTLEELHDVVEEFKSGLTKKAGPKENPEDAKSQKVVAPSTSAIKDLNVNFKKTNKK